MKITVLPLSQGGSGEFFTFIRPARIIQILPRFTATTGLTVQLVFDQSAPANSDLEGDASDSYSNVIVLAENVTLIQPICVDIVCRKITGISVNPFDLTVWYELE